MKGPTRRFTVARRTTAAAFAGVLLLSGLGWFPWFRGSSTGGRWFGRVPLVDPLATLETTLASRGLHGEVLLGAGLLIVVAALLGPVFCAWVCPLGLLLDLNQWLRRRVLRRAAARRPGLRVPREARWFVLGLMLGAAAVLRFPVFQTISPINFVGWSLVFGALPALAFVAALAVAEWYAPRLWCRSLCPLGAFYGLLGWFAPLRVRIHPSETQRSPCRLCSASCPMGIDIVGDYTSRGRSSVDDPDCTRCGACTEACPRHTLALRFRDFPPDDRPPGTPPGPAPTLIR